MKKILIVAIVLVMCIPSMCFAATDVLAGGWWDASLEEMIAARDQLNAAIADKGGEVIVSETAINEPEVDENPIAESMPNPTAAPVSIDPGNVNLASNVIATPVGSKTKELSFQVVGTKYNYWVESTGSLYRFGCVEILNTGNEAIFLKDCSFDYEDETGKLIETNGFVGVSSVPDVIHPGERGYFYTNSMDNKFKQDIAFKDGYMLRANFSLEKAEKEYTPFTLAEANLSSADRFGKSMPAVTGRIVNNTDKDVSYDYVTVVYKDAAGKVLHIQGTSVENLYVGVPTAFNINPSYFTNPELSMETVYTCEIYPGPHYYQY